MMKAKAVQLRTELRNTKLGTRTMEEYLLRIKAINDSLCASGDPISPSEQLNIILQGLPPEYDALVTCISSRFEPLSLEELEALLLAQESRLADQKQALENSAPIVNLAQHPSQGRGQNSYFRGSNRGGRGFRGRGRGGRSSVQCQLCYKYGHLASVCRHRFNQGFTPQMPQHSPLFYLNRA